MKVDEELTEKIADLARLKLSREEIASFTPQVQEILDYVKDLEEVDVSRVDPMTHPLELETPFRADQVQDSERNAEGTPEVLKNGPEVIYDGYKVPPIL